jgi:CheY-like chemotaxis protein
MKKILIVDDEEVIRMLYGEELEEEGYEVITNIPVILCSAYSSFKGDLKSIAADYYVVKSADLSELKQKIKMALEGQIPPQPSLK